MGERLLLAAQRHLDRANEVREPGFGYYEGPFSGVDFESTDPLEGL